MPRFLSSTPLVAYAALTAPNPDEDCDLNLLRRWCLKLPIQVDILAEEIHPSESSRPLWNEVLSEIERGAISTLVVPSLFHIAGDDLIALSKFLTFLKMHRATLKSLAEVIDSRRESKTEIVLRLAQDTGKLSPKEGVL